MRMTTSEPRLLIYSQDGLGLGHLRRTSLLAGEFLAARPGASVLTVSDSPIGQFFAMPAGHDYLKLPTIKKAGPGDWRPVKLSAPYTDVHAMRQEVLRSAALSFDPDVVLVDHMPHGAMGELLPTLEALAPRGVKFVLGLRDILDAPVTIRRRWQLEGAFEAVEEHFQRVLVYGSKDVFDVAAQYGWPRHLSDRLAYCGYVCAAPPSSPVDAIRRRYVRRSDGTRLIVAMAGGGADAHRMFVTLLRSVPAISRETSCALVVVTGPFLPAEQRIELERLARGLPVHLVPSVSDSMSYMQAADLIVAMAGYNTSAEILSLGKPALLIPREGPSAEQRMRASLFAERGWVRWLPPETLAPEALSASVLEALDDPIASTDGAPDLRGRWVAAGHLLDELAETEVGDGRRATPSPIHPAVRLSSSSALLG